MKPKIMKAYAAFQTAIQRGVCSLKSNKGGTDDHTNHTAYIIIGIVAVTVIIAFLLPLLKNTVFPSIQKSIEDLFNAV